ncbi:tetratricopeptide (TPR) repeat protein [Dysgonomonas hofstadii]|uniref:Tetratricopeptide (TPR) repeat protein n=1 Tax=Dysgonomonas hofstadii TaxID=637886 RepID=A0A840CNI8_9BACT|nr:tetratricopeptide repeat protein [Dysgonomonas hofstadii]MBB4036239.1 tetratricopeptide (TPR) repeat protein [Dysgonomonas hofstadii]
MRNCLIIFFLLFTTLTTYAQPSSEKLIRQGVALHDKGRYKEAIACYEEALKVNPSSMSAVYEMSLSYLHLKDYDKALRYSTRVITANFQPLLVDAYIVKGTVLANQNKIADAINLLNEAVEKCGDEYLLHFNLGLCYFNGKNNKMAAQHLRKAIEIDATHASAFLLYAYALNDLGQWLQSFYSFHFFLLLEPNTERSKDAFGEMLDLLNANYDSQPAKLEPESGVDRHKIYEAIKRIRTSSTEPAAQYKFYEEASKTIFFQLGQLQDDTQTGLMWFFFVPTYDEILGSGHFETYCRYVSVSYFPESLEWWDKNKTQVDNFIEWFESGQSSADEDADFGDDSDL